MSQSAMTADECLDRLKSLVPPERPGPVLFPGDIEAIQWAISELYRPKVTMTVTPKSPATLTFIDVAIPPGKDIREALEDAWDVAETKQAAVRFVHNKVRITVDATREWE